MVETLSNARMISRRYLSDAGNRTFIVTGCLVLAVVVQGRLVDLTSPHLALYLWIILLLGAMAVAVLQLSVGDDRASVETASSAAVAPIPAIPLAVVGLGCAAVSARLVATDEWNAQWWWLAAMALPLLGLIADAVRRRSRLSPMKIPVGPRELAGLIPLVAVSLVLRLVNLTASPPLLHGDEASCGLYGRLFNAGHSPLLSISWFGLPMLSYAISGVGLHFFGDNVTGLRTINAVIGTASIVLLYFLGKEWFGRRAAVLAAVLLCFAFLHLELSRDGLHYVQGPACITLSLYLCTLWLKRGGIVTAYLTGMSFALALQVYWSARIAPLLVAGLLGFLFLRYRALLLARWRELAWVGVGTV
ncbi:MAG TPA: glycosyltransferase family 39 protein, partial [Chloroflexota bacterium]